jgi:hypothetical protein
MGEERRSGASSAHIPRLEDAVHGSPSGGSGSSMQRQGGQGRQGRQGGNGQQNSLSGLLGDQGEWTERIRHTVREHPLAAVAGALVLGSLLSRRRH